MEEHIMKRRLVFLLVLMVFCFVVLLFRMGYIQIIRGNDISDLAYKLWGRNIPIEGQRGNIYDRNGNLIVGNQLAPSVAVIPKQIDDVEYTANFLSNALGASKEEIKKHITKNVSIELLKPEGRKLDLETVEMIMEENLHGVYIVGDTKRYYPYDDYLAQVLGFTGIDNQGIAGIEYIYDDYLMGSNGNITVFTDAKGNLMSNLASLYQKPSKGLDVHLTIDLGVQMVLERVLENAVSRYSPEQVLGLAMNPKTGEILAMSSYPTFHPGDYQSYPQEIYNRNLPIWMSYEPGSTFKIITYAAGLEEGVFTLDEGFFDPGYYMVDGARLKDWKAGGHGQQTFLEVIQNSCNPGFVEIGLRLGEETFFEYVEKFGFGSKTGVDLLGESTGIVFNTENIGLVELATSAFGQGNSVTPIQLSTAVSAAVNGGFLYQPYILKGFSIPNSYEMVFENTPKFKHQVISQETSKTVAYALESVVAMGTGRGAYLEGYRVGGKTGTAQKAENGVYLENNYILSFIGVAPMNDPELLVYIAIDNPKNTIQYGGVVAAPLVKEVMSEALPLLGIKKQQGAIEKEYRYWIDVFYYDTPSFIGKDVSDIKTSPYYKIEILGQGDMVIDQIPKKGEKIPEGGTIILYTK